jgi:hypothetical protein
VDRERLRRRIGRALDARADDATLGRESPFARR